MSERVLRKEVDVLTNVWQIDEDEVMSRDLELLGSGASGRVYKASYRNIIVAVKKMMAVGFRKSIEDFETEIKFMRTVRHKNIVLFIGAGKSQPGDVPFLVMEYMERGSLRNVLYDLSIDIDYERKLSFAMDSARGMHFLHTLEPPRIHRDLKSDNLLVSKDWIVKVADFGLGRDVTGNVRSNDGQQNRCRYRSDPQTIPLLPQRDGLSFSGVGTARWQAPELILREPYDTAVDVYSFGIVLWEIWTRQLPFGQYRYHYQVSDAVIDKERPVIPRDCPQPFAIIMKNCWSPRPSDRLSFGQVISQLESLQTI
ncbi:dual specificity protein kinase shkA-like [Corticium candelabrum]|uniref:dual specificity protein kinase shkA-like n=1 Tax=Corticium candelabrum TaxID=121492 RepID=UPI002E25DBC4|nr:dual specificity protein kinase shkA-like [Corticium candelabrum]